MTGVDDRDERDLDAAEYVLGTLDEATRRRVEARLAGDPETVRLVASWEARLGPLVRTVAPVDPPPELWRGIERRLDLSAAPATIPDLTQIRRLRRGLALWRGVALATTAAAAALAVYVAAVPAPPQTSYVAVLNDEAGKAAWLVRIDPEAGEATVRPVGAPPSGDRAYELWLLPPDAAPRSLGVVGADAAGNVPIPADDDAALPAGVALAVSLEPAGGSPTGQPTGPVTSSGQVLLLEP